MKRKIFFEENPKDLESADYLALQEDWQRDQLKSFVTELEETGRIEHSDARSLGDGKWSLWVRAEGRDAINHVCYSATKAADELSPLAQSLLNPRAVSRASSSAAVAPRRTLVILAGIEIQGCVDDHPGYYSVEEYASRMDTVKRAAFYEAISAIRRGTPSRDYTDAGGDIYKIHIDHSEEAYGVHIHCEAKWIEL